MSFKIIIGADLVPTASNYDMFKNGLLDELIGEQLKQILKNADFTIFNLEVPLTDCNSPILKCGPRLIAPTKCINGIQKINPHFFTLANNHIMDQGEQGLRSTMEILSKAGVQYAGAGSNLQEASKPYIIDNGITKIGIYCCAEHEFSIATEKKAGANPFDPLESFDHIVSLKELCDFIIVLYHGGKEHYRYPAPYLQKICRKFVEKGADLVVCQHSHCIGCEEKWEKGTIVYGQGNFLFDSLDNDFWRTSLLLSIEIGEQGLSHIEYIPIVKNGNCVMKATSAQKKEILDTFTERNSLLKSESYVIQEYQKLSDTVLENYLSALQGKKFKNVGFKICNRLLKRKLRKWIIKRLYGKEELVQLLNYFECEAHRELIIQGLKDVVSKV